MRRKALTLVVLPRAGSVVSGYVTYYYGFPTSTGLFGTVVIVVALVHANIHVFCQKRITYQSLESLDMLQECQD